MPIIDDSDLLEPEANARLKAAASPREYARWLAGYPLYPQALGCWLLAGVLLWLMLLVGSVVAVALSVILAVLAQYLMGVVQGTALGQAAPPILFKEIVSQPGYVRLLALVTYLLPLTLVVAFAAYFRLEWLAYPLLALGAFVFPAFVAVLALADDVREAGSHLRMRHFILQTGGAYAAVCLPMTLLALLAYGFRGGLVSLVCALLAAYLLVVACHLLGFVALHRYTELNVALEELQRTDTERQTEAQRSVFQKLLTEVDRLIAAGDPRSACFAMFDIHESLPDELKFHEDLYAALCERHQDVLMLVQGKRLIHLLMQKQRIGRALSVYEQCLDISGLFEPWDMKGTLRMAESALQEHRLPLFDKIALSISLRQPDKPEAVALQFRRARYLAEVENDHNAALATLTPLLKAREHPLHARILALYQALKGKPV